MDLLAIDWSAAAAWMSEPLHIIDAASTVLGLIYLYLEYKASIWLWLVSIIMPIVHSVLYFKAGLYADFGMEFFYVLVAIYGFLSWKFGKHSKQSREVPITHFPRRLIVPTVVVFALLWWALWWLLTTVTPSTVPVCDAFTTALSIIAYWALARKWAEQWLLWLVVDAVCTVLYVYKSIPFTASLYGFYTVMAVVGYRKWLRLMRQQQVQQQPVPEA